MKTFAIALVLLCAGCEAKREADQVRAQHLQAARANLAQPDKVWQTAPLAGVSRIVDAENGTVCYAYSNGGIDCVHATQEK